MYFMLRPQQLSCVCLSVASHLLISGVHALPQLTGGGKLHTLAADVLEDKWAQQQRNAAAAQGPESRKMSSVMPEGYFNAAIEPVGGLFTANEVELM